jgi:N-acetylglucosaminyldiphosphoundecaprenol N-acetyl-beta-D-mannosaminyltransferase
MNQSVNLFGMRVDAVRMSEAVTRLVGWVEERSGMCRYVVTPNVDHAVLFQHHAGLRNVYDGASLILADGMPVVLASRLLGRPLPERVTGSDLVPELFSQAGRCGGLRVFLLGAAPGVATKAAAAIRAAWPGVEVVGTFSPPHGFEARENVNREIIEAIRAARPDVLVVGLGAPKQELWVHAHRHEIAAPVAICAGAVIDFLAGEKARAPKWMRRTGLEWLHRLGTEPRRLARRYARDAWLFPKLVLSEWLGTAGHAG